MKKEYVRPRMTDRDINVKLFLQTTTGGIGTGGGDGAKRRGDVFIEENVNSIGFDDSWGDDTASI